MLSHISTKFKPIYVHVNVSNDPDPLLPIENEHPALNISLDCNQFDLLQIPESVYDFKNCNYINIINYL